MKFIFVLIFYILRAFLMILKPGGTKALLAENTLLRKQLIIASRRRKKSPNLSLWERLNLAFLTSCINPNRLARIATIIKPSRLIKFHKALIQRKYRILFSNKSNRKPGPVGPSQELIKAINEILDHTLFWTDSDLQSKLNRFQQYFNEHRTHMGLKGSTLLQIAENKKLKVIDINNYRWKSHCRGLFQLPIAA